MLEPDAAATLPRLAAAFDEPLGDEAALPLFLICEAARERGDRRARRRRRRRGLRRLRALRGDGTRRARAGPRRRGRGALAARASGRACASAARRCSAPRDFLEAAAVPARRALRTADGGLHARTSAASCGRTTRGRRSARSCRTGFLLGGAPAGIAGLQRLDIDTYLPGDLLPKSDIASMAHSLELRSPLLDHRVVELGLSLPDRLKRRGREGKIALRRAFADDLPPKVADRGKSGFGVPARTPGSAASCDPLARELLLDESSAIARLVPAARPRAAARGARGRTRRQRPPALDARHARAVAARARRRARSDDRVSRRTGYSALAFLCAAPRLVVLLHEREPILVSNAEKSDFFAQTFVAHGTFGFIPGEPSAYTQPLYGWFLDPGLLDLRAHAGWSIGLAQIVLAVVTALLVYEIGRRLLGPRAGLVGAAIATLNPYLIWHDVHVNREIVDQVCAAALVLLTLAVAERPSPTARCASRRRHRPRDARQHAARRRPVLCAVYLASSACRVPVRPRSSAGSSLAGAARRRRRRGSCATRPTSAAGRSRPTAARSGRRTTHRRTACCPPASGSTTSARTRRDRRTPASSRPTRRAAST